jgi:hypothetical protein
MRGGIKSSSHLHHGRSHSVLPRSLNPSPSYYEQFNGYTLGLLFAVLSMIALWLVGKNLLARITLRHCSEAERAERLAKFGSTVLQRMLLVLYLVYPGACGTGCVPCKSAARCIADGGAASRCTF